MGLYWRKTIFCLIGYNVSSNASYSDGATRFERFELKISQISLNWVFNSCESVCFPQLCSFLWVAETNMTFEKSETVFDIIAPKLKSCHFRIVYQSYEDLLQVFLWSKSIQTTHQFQLSAFLTHVYLLDSLKLSICCKRAIVSFVLVFVCAVNNFVHDIIIKV